MDRFVLYGFSPERVWWGVAGFLIVGVVVFRRREFMELQNPDRISLAYNPVWYSLDLFLPFIDLQTANAWTPRGVGRPGWLRRHYMRLHTVFGWVPIPVGLLALTGIFN